MGSLITFQADRKPSPMIMKIPFFLMFFLLVAKPLMAGDDKEAGVKVKGPDGGTQLQMDKSQWGKVANFFDKAGSKRCAPRIHQVVDFLTARSKSGTSVFIPGAPRDPDGSMLSLSMEVANGDVLAYASASFHPRHEQECAGVYETVTYWQNACSEVAATHYPKIKRSPMLAQLSVLEVDTSTRIFLMPAGQGCVTIKKQVIF